VFEFTPNEATDLTTSGGVMGAIGIYIATKTVESITSYTMQGNLYVIVITS
jgi:hypothetical protein